MKPIHTFTVVPTLPSSLQSLREIAYNLFWAWDHETIELFRRLDRDLWESTNHNPVRMLGNISQSQLEAAAEDDAFLAHTNRVYSNLKEYVSSELSTWYEKTYGKDGKPRSSRGMGDFPHSSRGMGDFPHSSRGMGDFPHVAYFSTEFGVTECMPFYSGGLGILAGDHLKSASDLGLPLVGVGLLYQQGYFSQYLSADGWQQESYPDNDFYNMAVQLERNEDGTPVIVTVDLSPGPIKAQIWRAQVGRVPLFLLDTNIPENPRPRDRDIAGQLYVADRDTRIRQEIMLGIGGVRALDALGINCIVYHMNEGHSAFLALERICHLIEKHGLSFSEAREVVSATSIFTTHTSVPAGIEEFSVQLVEKYLKDYCLCVGIPFDEFLALGRRDPNNTGERFGMAVLALRLAAHSNGVSKLHGKVSRKMWVNVWPGVPEDEAPISSIVNGIHIRSWVSNDMEGLFDRYLGPRWAEDPSDPNIWERVMQIPADELWRTHERRRERLVAFARLHLTKQLKQRGALSSEIEQASELLNPEALTIGFARRFAGYKRATLLLRDPERLTQILCNKEHPVQIIYAGKAHPNDNSGKELIRDIIHLARQEELRRHIIFIEDYDMTVARYLVEGADLWLSTPRRPSEASGTSGMKAAANGVINMSILDGWWYEAYRTDIGWAIGRAEEDEYEDTNQQDDVESKAIYDMLEREAVPMFYDRGIDGLPRRWIARMKASMAAICPIFNTNRMVHEYIERAYHPCAECWKTLTENDFAKARALASWKSRIRQHWPELRIDNIEMDGVSEISVGAQITVKANIHLGQLTPEDVSAEIYRGQVNPHGEIVNAQAIRMNCSASHGDDNYTFEGVMTCLNSGLHGYSVRILPNHENLSNPYELGLIKWAS